MFSLQRKQAFLVFCLSSLLSYCNNNNNTLSIYRRRNKGCQKVRDSSMPYVLTVYHLTEQLFCYLFEMCIGYSALAYVNPTLY